MDSIPEEIIRHILQYLSFDEISRARLICKRFNSLGGQVLNDGFRRVRSFHFTCLKEIKEELPRRESERRKHQLYPRHDVLQAIETRLSLLSMTYSRLIGEGRICFIPGKVLDELFRILRIVQEHNTPLPNSVTLLQEMRDISSMAMEHFEEEIQPQVEVETFGKRVLFNNKSTDFLQFPSVEPLPFPIPESSNDATTPLTPTSSKKSTRRNRISSASRLQDRISSQNRVISRLRTKVNQLENTLSLTITEHKGQMNEIVKQVQVLQGLLGVQHRIPTPNLNPGTSGDYNNNIVHLSDDRSVGLFGAEKRTFTRSNSLDSEKVKRRRKT